MGLGGSNRDGHAHNAKPDQEPTARLSSTLEELFDMMHDKDPHLRVAVAQALGIKTPKTSEEEERLLGAPREIAEKDEHEPAAWHAKELLQERRR